MFILRIRRLMMFYRQLATLITGGIPIVEAMGILSTHAGYIQLTRAAQQMRQYLLEGKNLGDAFAHFPDIFPSWQINIIKYSENSGRLADGLGRLADYLERDYASFLRVVTGLAYPVFLLHIAFFLLPLSNLFCGGGYIAGVFRSFIMLYGSLFLVYLAGRMLNTAQFKTGFDTFLLAIPVLGNIVRKLAVARFVRALQCLCNSGVGIVGAWKMAAEACGNNVIRDAAFGSLALLEQGEELSKAFIQARMLSPQMMSMIVTAEKSGSIVQALNTIATYTEKDNDAAIAVVTGLIPVVVYLLIVGFIAFRIISFYSGYFNRIQSF